MKMRWVRRRAHQRRLTSGQSVSVCQSWVFCKTEQSKKTGSYHHSCPECGANILSVRMPNGGMAHFEGGKGLGRIKHPCLYLGQGLSRVRDEHTPDLFAVARFN